MPAPKRRMEGRSGRKASSHTGSIRCAIYTRKSSDEGLEQEFNSLDAQREACEAYIISQRHEGWVAVPDLYDDGGLSGGSMERPALKRLMADIAAGRIDIVVVYKVDRLTRSLADFAKIVDILDGKDASFVSVTQQFNTTTSMGRLTLNMLLSFAQFEREIAGERIRDKIAASKARGMWMGGNLPLGYDAIDRKLVINDTEAKTVRLIFERYAALGSVRALREELARLGIVSKRRTSKAGITTGGQPFSRGSLYALLQNPLYIGKIAYRGEVYGGQHDPIIGDALWDRVQTQLANNRTDRKLGANSKEPSLLAGLVYDADGNPMTPSHANKAGRRYRYYVSTAVNGRRGTGQSCMVQSVHDRSSDSKAASSSVTLRIPAHEIDRLVTDRIHQLFQNTHDVLDAITELQLDAKAIQGTLKSAEELARCWSTMTLWDHRSVILAIINRIDVRANTVMIHLERAAFVQLLNPATLNGQAVAALTTLILKVDVVMKRSPQGATIIVPSDQPDIDQDLLTLICQAFQARDALMTERHDSIEALSKGLGITKAKATNLLRLSWLAPSIIKTILDGNQPVGLTRKTLLAAAKDLPKDWAEQAKYLTLPAN